MSLRAAVKKRDQEENANTDSGPVPLQHSMALAGAPRRSGEKYSQQTLSRAVTETMVKVHYIHCFSYPLCVRHPLKHPLPSDLRLAYPEYTERTNERTKQRYSDHCWLGLRAHAGWTGSTQFNCQADLD